ncbi:MAG: CoA transferase [Dehalococcoidia bacterium]|nr:CoA transferase [Dehalococcoidia bacterium]
MFDAAMAGVRIIDLTHHIAGPYCTKLLADYGADVVKVEKPGEGDPARRLAPFLGDVPHPEKSGLFAYLNTNKRGITLNLRSQSGREILLRLVENADILIENFAPRVMPDLGLTYETLKEINPRLVMVSISNFGQTGPYRDYKASELVLNAMGGEMYSRGLADREPLKLGGDSVQFQAGTVASLATSIALWAAEEKGIGDHLDVSIFETQIGSIDLRGGNIMGYGYTKRVEKREEGAVVRGYPEGVYICSDGYVQITGRIRYWPRILKMLDYPEELSVPVFGTAAGQANGDMLDIFNAYFIPWCLDRTKSEIFLKGQAANVLVGPLNTMEDIANDPQFESREFFVEVEHPAMGKLTMPGAPYKMAETPWEMRRPAPLLGQHNEEVLGSLGYDRENLVKLREAGVI